MNDVEVEVKDTEQDMQQEKTTSRRAERVENYRLLHRAMMLSAGNYLAVVAMAGVVMARAQGAIQRGKHARRQTMLAMGQALHSAGRPMTSVSLAALFLEMQHAGLLVVTRDPKDRANKSIIDVEVAHERRGLRHQREIGNHFELTWSPTNVECFHTLAMARTPRATIDFSDAKDSVLETPDPLPEHAPNAPASMRTFWVDEGFVEGPMH